jgi:hypothetical protein
MGAQAPTILSTMPESFSLNCDLTGLREALAGVDVAALMSGWKTKLFLHPEDEARQS